MPELPEVETVARDLRCTLVGRQFVSVTASIPGVLRHPTREVFVRSLPGERVEAVVRQGKFILCSLHGGSHLIFHLGMTGHLVVCDPALTPVPHTHMVAGLDDGRQLRFDDARRFGRILLGPRALLERARILPKLGVEPLSPDFTAARLGELLRHTRRTVKAALLDQSVVAGLGNIYVDEACHLAGVRPGRRSHRLTRAQRVALAAAIPAVLTTAIANRGTTFNDYRDLWNVRGTNQDRLQVYGRANAPCYRCGLPLRRSVIAGRTTVYCAGCQR